MIGKRATLVALIGLSFLTAACTDSDPTNTGIYRVEFLLSGSGGSNVECAVMDFETVWIRALDGACGSGPNLGEPCGQNVDCNSGSCVGALGQELIPTAIGVVSADQNLARVSFTGSPCELPPHDGGGTVLPSVLLPRGIYTLEKLDAGNFVIVSGGTTEQCGGTTALLEPFAPADLRFEVGPSSSAVTLSFDIAAIQPFVAPTPSGGNPSCTALAASADTIIAIN